MRFRCPTVFLNCLLFAWSSALPLHAATTGDTTVGVNVVGVQNLSEQQQDALIEQLQKAGVKTVRTGLGDKFTYFIVSAFRHGIGTVAIVYPTEGSSAASQHARPADPPLSTWAVGRLSDADPEGFKQWLTPLIATLQQAGVKLTALEIGNELNSPGYNGDFLVPGDGRILGFNDLENGWKAWFYKRPITDPEASALAKGFYVYLSILDSARTVVRSVSPLNKDTPIISAGAVYNTDLPHPASSSHNNGRAYGVPAADFIHFLRQHGLDDRADGYGIHIYYATPANIESALSICGGPKNKPCWLTEWGGFPTTGATCPLGHGAKDDVKISSLVSTVRETLKPFVNRRLLVNTMYYSWNSGGNIYIPACNGVTRSGMLAITPFE
jgi:hypothetical protein